MTLPAALVNLTRQNVVAWRCHVGARWGQLNTSMLGATQRRALVSKWPLVITQGVLDEFGNPLQPGDLVRLPLCVRHGTGPEVDVPGTIMGYAIDKLGTPSVVVDAPV